MRRSGPTDGREHAVMIGAGIAGLTAARVLVDAYRRVTVVDRDALDTTSGGRSGVPQGRHLHTLMPRGLAALEELFPGFASELAASGGVPGELGSDARLYFEGGRLATRPADVQGVALSRPLVEGTLRARVRALPNVSMLDGCGAGRFETGDGGRRITGVRVQDAHGRRTITADLVVDATGRGSRTPQWLARLGYDEPPLEEVRVQILYSTRTYGRSPQQLNGDRWVVVGATVESARGGVLSAIEGDRWMLTLAGAAFDPPPTDPEGFEAFARDVAPEFAEICSQSEPLDDPVRYRITGSVRRRYERLRRFPEGLLVVGDGLCAFNPVYAQGMTVSALEALALRDLLAAPGPGLARRFFRRAARIIDGPWTVAAGGDLRHPLVEGRRTLATRFQNAYMARLVRGAHNDAVLANQFLRVIAMLDAPQRVLRPRIVVRTLRASRKPYRVQDTPARARRDAVELLARGPTA